MTLLRWHIELFGSLRLLQDDRVVCAYPPSKVGELLAYLACHSSRWRSMRAGSSLEGLEKVIQPAF